MKDFFAPISEKIWDDKYRYKNASGVPIDQTVDDTWRRVAKAIASVETSEKGRQEWEDRFYRIMGDGIFSPAGRIIAGAGTGRNVTLSNCLSGETLILTAEYGLVAIGEIAGETVSVLDGNGTWVSAPINTFGEQPVAPVTLKGGYKGRERKTIYATAGHRWILEGDDESTTEYLDAGNVLKTVQREDIPYTPAYQAGIRHGIIYGDGSQRPEGEVKLRLCGAKKSLAGYFNGWTMTTPPHADGDICVYLGREIGRELDLKSLPVVGASAEYLTGFLRGWMATDGCVSQSRALISCGADEADWLKRYGPVAGMEVSCVTKLGDETNYGQRNKAIFNVHFHRWTMIPEDFVLEAHRDKFEARSYPWIVESVGMMGEAVPVYCPRVTTTDSVQLDLGVHTGQCFTMGTVPDSMDGIFSHLREAALTMQMGGGIGYDFSPLRPSGAPVVKVAADASGPLSFMDVWDSMCRTVMSAGSRRGAMMATIRCDHPDVEAFITAKQDPLRLRMFNVSVLVTDDLMAAVEADGPWHLCHEVAPASRQEGSGETSSVVSSDGIVRHVYKTIRARDLWDKIMRSTYDYAEPGVLFIDRINDDHNIGYLERIATTNPCAEKPMGPYASCLLGSINLARLVSSAFTSKAKFDIPHLREAVSIAIRFMDNVVDAGRFPLPAQHDKAQADRQLGLGVTGLADALLMLGIRYGSPEAVLWTDTIMRELTLASYRTSIQLAEEKGAFPTFEADPYLHPKRFAGRMLPKAMQADIRRHGIRNALLVSIAPTGTISLFAGNVSSGIEPVFAYSYTRKVLEKDGKTKREERVVDFAVAIYESAFGQSDKKPDWFVTTDDLTPGEHIAMMAAAQKWVDSSISKTVNLPEDISFEDFKAVYRLAYDSGCKGCTTYRPNAVTGSVLTSNDKPPVTNGGPALTDVAFPTPGLESLAARDATAWTHVGTAVKAEVARVTSVAEAMLGEPEPRQKVLDGKTYKIKLPNDDHALYVTVNDIVTPHSRRPFEVFINSKNMQHYAWTVALTRMVSAVFRRGGDVSFVVEELKAVFDPAGGAWDKGVFIPSVPAAIGRVIGEHMEAIGYTVEGKLNPNPDTSYSLYRAQERSTSVPAAMSAPYGGGERASEAERPVLGAFQKVGSPGQPAFCPTCFSTNLKNENGCLSCLDCGNSKCG